MALQSVTTSVKLSLPDFCERRPCGRLDYLVVVLHSSRRMGLRPKPPSDGGYNKLKLLNESFLSNATACCCLLPCQVLHHDVARAVCVPVRLIGTE